MRNTISNEIKFLRELFLLLALTSFSLSSNSATIQVTAQIGAAGCDLAEAITAANRDAPTGGCIANNGSFATGGNDVILLNFDTPISEFIVSSAHIFDNGLPSIHSDIAIIGRGGTDKVVIKRSEEASTPNLRFFNVATNGKLSLENISLQNGKVASDTAGNPGVAGAIVVQGGILEVKNCEFLNNQGSLGGAIYTSNQRDNDNVVIIRDTLFLSNQSTEDFSGGGAILHQRGELTIIDSAFVANQSAALGGALRITGNSTSTTTLIRNTLFTGNTAAKDGGAIQIDGIGTISIYDSTISNNSADTTRFGYGGGVALHGGTFNDYDLSLTNTTITGNAATRGGGIGLDTLNPFDDSSLTIINSLVTGNSSISNFPSGHEILFGPQMISLTLRNNLIGHRGHTTAEAISGDNLNLETNILATSDGDTPTALNKILLPLADNGGPTRTHALAEDSPALDAATEGTVIQVFVFTLYLPGCRGEELGPITPLPSFRSDQRGIERPIGGACDIGSYEEEDPDDSQCFVVTAANNNVAVFCL